MTRVSRDREEALLKKLLPWLSKEYGQELCWLGCPEDTEYESACVAARGAANPLDAELQLPTLRLAVEHTSTESFPGQRQDQAAFRELGAQITKIRHIVPYGNDIQVSVSRSQIMSRKVVDKATPELIERLTNWFGALSTPASDELCVRGNLLEEPFTWTICDIKFTISRLFCDWDGWVSLMGEYAEPSLDMCLEAAIRKKITDKASTLRAYHSEGWKTILVVELAGIQSSLDSLGSSFERISSGLDLTDLDAIALVQNTFGLGYCWAYKDGRIPPRKERLASIRKSRQESNRGNSESV